MDAEQKRLFQEYTDGVQRARDDAGARRVPARVPATLPRKSERAAYQYRGKDAQSEVHRLTSQLLDTRSDLEAAYVEIEKLNRKLHKITALHKECKSD